MAARRHGSTEWRAWVGAFNREHTATLEAAIAGKLVSVPWPWPSVGALTQSLMPGAITLLVGSPGASKSFLILQAVLHWLEEGHRCALLELEEGADFWLCRALALVAECGSLTDPAWIAAHPDEARRLLAHHRDEINNLAAILTTSPAAGMTLEQLASWVEDQAKAGARIIAADPLTAAIEPADRPWAAAQAFMGRVKRAIVGSGASLVLTSHGKKQNGRDKAAGPDLDSMAGGSGFSRFASCVLWLEALAEPEQAVVLDAHGRERQAEINRRLRILKSREGRGTGLVLGMWFHGGSLCTTEAGIITTSAAQSRRANCMLGSDGRERVNGSGPERARSGQGGRGDQSFPNAVSGHVAFDALAQLAHRDRSGEIQK